MGGKTIAQLCGPYVGGYLLCPGSGSEICTFPKTPGFAVCGVLGPGVPGEAGPCPAALPVQHTIYFPVDACGCSCGPPVGDVCSVEVTVYEDSACSTPAGTVTAASNKPAACVDLPAGTAAASMTQTLTYTSGTCKPAEQPPQGLLVCCQQ
jgi:hypothetical protein